MKRAVLVNGIPASGKSSVARGISARTGWLVFALDTVKEPFFDHLGIGDREFNRKLGRASYQAIWSIVADAPPGTTVIVDAWFGFQPAEVLDGHLQRAGVGGTAEIWCHAPADVLAKRYADRLDQRHAGHPGAAFIPELIALAERATPLRRGPLFDVDTSVPTDFIAIESWLKNVFAGGVENETYAWRPASVADRFNSPELRDCHSEAPGEAWSGRCRPGGDG